MNRQKGRTVYCCLLEQSQNTDHASGPESISGDVDNPADFIDEADVDDVEDDAQRADDKARDAQCEQLYVAERRDHVAGVTKVQHGHRDVG